MANGGRRQLFNLETDPDELVNCVETFPQIAAELHALAVNYAKKPGYLAAFDKDDFRVFQYTERPRPRMNQMAHDLGIRGFSFLP